MAMLVTGTFVFGALLSATAGYVGMWIAVRANVRTAAAAMRSYDASIKIALRSGAVCGLLVVGLCVFGIASIFVVHHVMFPQLPVALLPNCIVGFGFGASLVALFAQLGGGIFTKAADVGADLVGKVEENLPEDDPRNPAVIADLVGDNVGDCAGRGADLFESIAAEIIGAMILGSSLAQSHGLPEESIRNFILFPLVVHTIDMVVSSVGVMSVYVRRTTDYELVALRPGDADTDADHVMGDHGDHHDGDHVRHHDDDVSGMEDPLLVMKRGYCVSLLLGAILVGLASSAMLHSPAHPRAWWCFTACVMLGLANALLSLMIAQYYTDSAYAPVRYIATAAQQGHATAIIAGVGTGLKATTAPVMCIACSILIAYYLGEWGMEGGGLFGTAVATMGMLSSAVYVLAMDTFGPIADNAGGIAEMTQQPRRIREITDRLDAVGNTTKAATKGFSIGSAGLACFLLFSAYMDVISEQSGLPFKSVDFAVPEVFVGGLLGGGVVFLFSGLAIDAVGTAAQIVVREVRQQFAERPGIMNNTEQPDYNRCVSIVNRAALSLMRAPGLVAILTPVCVGAVFRVVGHHTHRPLLAPMALAGFMVSVTMSGILLSLFFNTSGGAWDNAKKFIEQGNYGGKGSETHRASVTGDTVGDPFKDTAGPSLHVLIKLVATVSLVLGPLFIAPLAVPIPSLADVPPLME
eukprot:c5076_g1_i1.p1 GENE.c5076_g1_i1~~c5076_g1_i1.p1  ORF type:complete len:810 (+),score=244.87 c5076_g1_i1:352-2430(+)